MRSINPPIAVWENISMDFITSLPTYLWHSVIMAIIDRFLEAGHFDTLPFAFSAFLVAELSGTGYVTGATYNITMKAQGLGMLLFILRFYYI